MIEEKHTHLSRLEKMIADWAEQEKLLSFDEILEVELHIKKVPKVTVKIEGYHGTVRDPDTILVTEIGFTPKTERCLDLAYLKTIGDIRKKSLGEILKYRNFGKRSAREIADKLQNLGIPLDWDFDKHPL